jgi:hypothetical protein
MSDTDLLTSINASLSTIASAVSSGKSLVGGASGKNVDLGNLISGASQAATGLIAAGSAGHEFHDVMAGATSLIPGFAGTVSRKFVDSLEEGRQANIRNFNQGIGGLQLTDLNAKTAAVGLTQDQYRQILLQSNTALSGLGSTVQSGSNNFLKFANDFQSTPIIREMLRNGEITRDQATAYAAISQYGSKVRMDDINQMHESSAAASVFVAELTKASTLTGKSRDVIAAEIEERLKSPIIQAQLNQMTEEQRQSFVKNQVQLSGMGSSVQDLSAALGTGARLSKDQLYQLAAMGPAAGEFTRASRMAAMAQTDDQRRQAEEAMNLSRAHVAAYQGTTQYANVMKSTTGAVQDAYVTGFKQNTERDRILAEQRNTGLTATSALTSVQERVTNVVKGKTEEGKENADANTQRLVTDVQLRAQAAGAGMIGTFHNLEMEFGKNGTQANELIKKYANLAIGTGDVKDQTKLYTDMIHGLGTALKSGTATAGSSSTPYQPGQIPKAHAFGGISDVAAIFGEAGPEAAVPLPDGRSIPVNLNIGDALAKMQQAMNTGMATATSAVAASPKPSQPQVDASGGVTIKDLHSDLQELNKNIMRMISNTDDMVIHTKNTARSSKAASGVRNR